MAPGGADIDAPLLQLFPILGKTGCQRPRLGQDGIKHRGELAREVNHHENGGRKLARKFAGQKAQRLNAARGRANGEDIAVRHAFFSAGLLLAGLEPSGGRVSSLFGRDWPLLLLAARLPSAREILRCVWELSTTRLPE